jgi:hypothetical protein
MNLVWLLKSSTIWIALLLSGAVTASILLFTPGGMPLLRKRQNELITYKHNLYAISKQNRFLSSEIRRLSNQDGELMESLVRRLGYDRSGEVVYVFGDSTSKR